MSQERTQQSDKTEKDYRREDLQKEDKVKVQAGKSTVFQLKPNKFYFSF